MRFVLLCAIVLSSGTSFAEPSPVADGTGDTVTAVQRRTLRQAHRLEMLPYGQLSIADPYLQRWGGGLRALYHLREGLAFGLDGHALATYATQELVIARRELKARVIDSRERVALSALASIAPLYGKVALPGDLLVHFEIFFDAGLGGAFTETDSGHGVRPMLIAGVGQRVFLNDSFALTGRLGGDFYAERVLVNGLPSTKATGFWSLTFGFSIYLPGTDR